MESQKNAIVILLLVFGLLTSTVQAKSPSVLLQEGLYAEETEGDLEKAIKIYRQVIDEAGEIQRIGARATYQLGMCHLKKGRKEKASEYFQQIVSNYPTQKILVEKAQKQLEKIMPVETASSGAKYLFGPVIEKVINDDGVREDFMFDLDTGKFFSVSDAKKWSEEFGDGQEKSLEEFVMKSGVDLFGETSKKSLMGIDMIAIPTHNERWDMSPEDVIEQVSIGKPGTPVALSADGQLPKTFVFKTGQGGMGILQIIKMQADRAPGHFKIRYKMLQKEKAKLPIDLSTPEAIMTQEIHNTIDANALIHFKSPNRISNNNSGPITTRGFINSDFVMLTKMYEENGTAIPFKTTHEGNIYRYRITFNKPIMPGESMVYYTEGTIRGLIKPVPGSKNVFRYFMVHSPSAGQPVLRIETYLLPENAVFVSTSTPDIQKTEKDGRIELRVEKVVPANGSITTEFQYQLASSEPLTLAGVNMTVERAVRTISTCAEGDARVAAAMANIKNLDESTVLSELKKYLTSKEDTIRRSAIYVLWQGEFSNIDVAADELEKLCSHEEDVTRGMAGLALGQNKVLSSFTVLKKMTLDDPSGYARRCGAYALGLIGDTRAMPILEKALKDPDRLVQNNAKAAITMLKN